MANYRKKPVVIEAVQFDGAPEICQWTGLKDNIGSFIFWKERTLVIRTLEGDMIAQPGDWIIRGVKGELYPCKPDIFEATYELAEP